jgi:multicomponent Na+:H+ antiporter subunit F
MKIVGWLLGLLFIASFVIVEALFSMSVYLRWFYPLLLSCFLALGRIARGPTPSDRAAAVKILGILFIGFCGVLAVTTRWDIYIDIAIAWAIQSFIGTLALAKYIEGKHFDD